jgi:uncharacterized repeat protein (TIGR01451 family)
VIAAALLCGLIVARPAGVRSQGAAVPLGWTFTPFSIVEPGCRPRVTTAGLAYDSQGDAAAAWIQEICGSPIDPLFPDLPITPVRVARYLNGEWTAGAQLPDPACTLQGCPGLRGEPPGLALDPDGHPVVLYEAISDAAGTYSARRTRMVPGLPPESLTLGRIGHYQSCYTTWPAFSLLAGPPGNMVSVLGTSCQGTGWLSIGGVTIQGKGPDDAAAVGQGGAFMSVASAYGGGAFPRHVAYFVERGLSRGVYYAPNAGSVERLIATPHMNRGAEVSIAADANNTIHLVAGGIPVGSNTVEGGLLYATSTTDGESWTQVFIDEVSGRHPSIALDPAGRPAVAYWRGSELRFASFASGQWTNQLVTMTGTAQFANRPRLAFDPQGRPHILFLDPGSGNLQVANGAEGSHAPGMVKVDRAGSGHVHSLSPGIDCGTDCAESYPEGTLVTLVATGTPQVTRFAGWLGACTGTGPCTVRADAAQTSLTAMFARVYGGHEITVTSMAAGTGGIGDCTLGEAIQAANTDAAVDACPAGHEADVILVPAGEITIAGPYPGAVYGLPPIHTDITIRGSGQEQTFIQRRPFDADGMPIGDADPLGVFFVRPTGLQWPYTGQLHLEHLTVRGGKATGLGAAVYVQNGLALLSDVTFSHNTTAGVGGAVALNGGRLTIERARFLDNSSTSTGGALSATGILSVTDSEFARNTAVGNGGAVSTGGAGTVAAIAHSTFTANSAEWEGGAIHNTAVLTLSASIVNGNSLRSGFTGAGVSAGTLTLIDSVIDGNTHGSGLAVNGTSFVSGTLISSNNSGWSGGGVNARGNLTMVNSTISGNQASAHGGGIYFDHGQAVTLNNVTITNNRAVTGEGGGFYRAFSGAAFRLSNSIVAGNSGNGAPDCVGELGLSSATSLGYNVIGANTCLAPATGDLVGTRTAPLDPKLGPLQDNGGPTWTHALLSGSPALDAASPATPGEPGACETIDQRGLARPGRIACDIGAVERPNTLPTVHSQSIVTAEDTAVDITMSGVDDDGDAMAFVISRPPEHGSITGNGPTFTYTPFANYNGADSFSVFAADPFNTGAEETIQVTVTPVNDPPTATDDVAEVLANSSVSIDVLGNDSSAPDGGETLTIVDVGTPLHGTAVITDGGTFIQYTPSAGYDGPDTFTYSIDDGNGGTATARVKVIVSPSIDLAVTLTATMTPAAGRADLRYVVTVTNLGGISATNVRTTLTLPDGVTYTAPTCPVTGNTQTCPTTSLSPGTNVTFETLASTTTEGAVVAAAAVTTDDQIDPVLSNNQATVTSEAEILPTIVTIEITESIAVSDAPVVTPAVLISITENVAVQDAPAVTPAVQIAVTETIAVSDAPDVIPPVQPDQTPPSIVIVTPQRVAYLLNQPLVAEYSCIDTESGVASCVGPVASGETVSTSQIGGALFQVTATDNAGNVSTKSVPYSVTYGICTQYDESKAHNAGAVVPIKLQLCDAAGVSVSSEAIALTAVGLRHSGGATAAVETAGNANPGNVFRYDSGVYLLNLKTKKGWVSGTWTLEFEVSGDATVHHVRINIK